MKKILVSAAALSLGAAVMAEDVAVTAKAPTVYGRLAKNFTYAGQESDNQTKFRKIVPVDENDNAPSMFGVKGDVDVDSVKVGYKMELRFESQKADSGGDIAVRIAALSADFGYGLFQAGHDWTPTSLFVFTVDPLALTALSTIGIDQRGFVNSNWNGGTTKWDIANFNRFRTTWIGYTTPTFHGLKVTASLDQNDTANGDLSEARGTPKNQVVEVVAVYDQKIGDVDAQIKAAHINAGNGPETRKDASYLGAVKVSYAGVTLDGAYTTRSYNLNTNTNDYKDAFIHVGLKYAFNAKQYVAATWANAKFEDGLQSTANVGDWHKTNQYAIGYVHMFNKYVTWNTVAGLYKIETNTTKTYSDATIAAFNNKVKIFSTGIVLTF